MLVGIFFALVVPVLVFILGRIRIRISPVPERLNKAVALFVCLERPECAAFLFRDDIRNILFYPGLVYALEFLFLLLSVGIFLGFCFILCPCTYETTPECQQGYATQQQIPQQAESALHSRLLPLSGFASWNIIRSSLTVQVQ